jgi:hypothetical protein
MPRGNLPCSETGCVAQDANVCSYVDRRGRGCDSAWCQLHQQVVFNAVYCRRHAGVILALGPDHEAMTLPDLENRAPSLANWVGRDLDGPIRELLTTHFPGREMNVTAVVNAGGMRDRTWGRSWKVISDTGVDSSISLSVPQADDSIVRVIYDGSVLVELTPPWIEARRGGVTPNPEADADARQQFYTAILDHLQAAVLDAKSRPANAYRLRSS